MKYLKDIEKIAKNEHNLFFTDLSSTPQAQASEFFTLVCTELSLMFSRDSNGFNQEQRMAALLETLQSWQSRFPEALWQSCLDVLYIYVNSRDFPGVARYQEKQVWWGMTIASPTPALKIFNDRLQELQQKPTQWQWPSVTSIRATVLTFLGFHFQPVAGEQNQAGKIAVYHANDQYGPTRWMYPCGDIRFTPEDLTSNQTIPPLLLSEDDFARNPVEPLAAKISDYYDDILQSQLEEAAASYGAELRSLMKKYRSFFIYQAMTEQGLEKFLGIQNLKENLQKISHGCADLPLLSTAEADLRRLGELVHIEFFVKLERSIIKKQKNLLMKKYQSWFGMSPEVQEQWRNIFLLKKNIKIKISNKALAQACEANIQKRKQSIPILAEILRKDYRDNLLSHGEEIAKTKHHAEKALQRVEKTALGKLAKNYHTLMSGSLVVTHSEQLFDHSLYYPKKNQIVLYEDNGLSEIIGDTPLWLNILDGVMPGATSDQMLLEGLIKSLCCFITADYTNITENCLPYWDESQQQRWMAAKTQDMAYLKQIADIVLSLLQEKKLKKSERLLWNQLTQKVFSIYGHQLLGRLEKAEELYIRFLKTFDIPLKKINNAIFTPTLAKIAGEEIKLAPKYQKEYQVWHIRIHPACEEQSLVFGKLEHPQKLEAEELAISAFLWIYHRISTTESVSPLEFMASYGQALMALGGQEELAALFLPNLDKYIREVILPLGNKIYWENVDKLKHELKSEHESEVLTNSTLLSKVFRLFCVLSLLASVYYFTGSKKKKAMKEIIFAELKRIEKNKKPVEKKEPEKSREKMSDKKPSQPVKISPSSQSGQVKTTLIRKEKKPSTNQPIVKNNKEKKESTKSAKKTTDEKLPHKVKNPPSIRFNQVKTTLVEKEKKPSISQPVVKNNEEKKELAKSAEKTTDEKLSHPVQVTPSIQSNQVKTTLLKKRDDIVDLVNLVKEKYPDGVENKNAISIKTTLTLQEPKSLLAPLPGVEITPKFSNIDHISSGFLPKKQQKPVEKPKPVKLSQQQPTFGGDSREIIASHEIIPNKNSNKSEVVVHEDHKKMQLSADIVEKEDVPLAIIEKIIKCIENEFNKATGLCYDFSESKGMANILLTKFIRLSHFIKRTSPTVGVEVHGGMVRDLLSNHTPNDLDVILRTTKEFNVEQLLISLKGKGNITDYQKSKNENNSGLFDIIFFNSVVNVHVSHLKDSNSFDFTCNILTLEVKINPPSAILHIPENAKPFLIALKNRGNPLIEAVINFNHGVLLKDETIKWSIIKMVNQVLYDPCGELLSVIDYLLRGSTTKDSLYFHRLAGFVLTLLGLIQDPKRIFRLFHLYQKKCQQGWWLSPDLVIIVTNLIPVIFNTAIEFKNPEKEQKPVFNRNILKFYFSEHVLKNFTYFHRILRDDFTLFQAIMLAGLGISKDQEKINYLFSIVETDEDFEKVNQYISAELRKVKDRKDNRSVINIFLTSMTFMQKYPTLHYSFFSSVTQSAKFKEELAENALLLNHDLTVQQPLPAETKCAATSQFNLFGSPQKQEPVATAPRTSTVSPPSL